MAEGGKTEEFGDEQLEELFSAFDELSAPESLKAGTLAAIAGLSATAGAAGAAGAQAAAAGAPAGGAAAEGTGAAGTSTVESAPAGDAPKVTATRGRRPRVKGRGIRAAAVAASLALVVTGGVAYATPTSIVTVAQGESAIALGVNYFGTSVSASSDDAIGRIAVESSNLVHVPYGDALSRAANALDAAGASGSLELFVESADEGQRARLAGQNQVFLADREEDGAHPDPESPDGPGDGGQPGGQPGEQPGDQEAGARDGAQPDAAAGDVSAAQESTNGSQASQQPSAQDGAAAWYAHESTRVPSSGGAQQASNDGGSEASSAGMSWAVVKEPKADLADPGGVDGGENLAQRVPEVNEADGFDCRELPTGYFKAIDPDYSGEWTWEEGSDWWVGPSYPGWTWGDDTSSDPSSPGDPGDPGSTTP